MEEAFQENVEEMSQTAICPPLFSSAVDIGYFGQATDRSVAGNGKK